jgi:uroporphyrinogen decarboxylase
MENNLSTRELFQNIINFKSSPRTLKWEYGYWGGTINRWHSEGLVRKEGMAREFDYGDSVCGPAARWGAPSYGTGAENAPRSIDINDIFELDEQLLLVPYDCWIFPKYEEKIVYEDSRYKELYNSVGIRQKTLKDKSSMPLWLEYPVKSRKDWEEMKEEKLSLDSITKRWSKNKAEFIKKAKDRTFPLHLMSGPTGFFGSLRYLLGEDRLYITYYDDPYLLKDIADHLCNLWIAEAEELTSVLDFDIAGFWEDMAGKNGSLISPSLFKEFMTPYYKRLTGFIKSKKINNFILDSDGNVNELIPLFLEAGVNGLMPFEQQAGNDLAEIRKKYPELIIWGGIDKNELSKDKEHIDKELDKVSWLIKQGGYIPFNDHLVPPNVSWENFKYYREKLNKIVDSIQIVKNE